MTRPQFTFRPNLQKEDHRRAWEILQAVPERQKSAFLVQAILFRENENPVRQTCSEASPSANNKKEEASRESLETLLRRILREELSSVSPQAADETEVPREMMNFLSTLADYGLSDMNTSQSEKIPRL